jgi:cell division protein FtsB
MKSIIILSLGLLLAVRLGGNIWRIVKSGERVKQAEVELQQAKTEQEELKKRLIEVQSPEFVEREARDKLGFGREGEIILVLPQDVEMPNDEGQMTNTPNWRLWWDLYIGI